MAHITKNLTTYRIVLLMAILCCGCLNLSVQNVLTGSSNLFKDSDIVMMQPMDYSWAGDEGENVVWNFSAVRESKGEHSIEFHAGSLGAIQKIEDDNIYTYYYRDSSLYQTGFENRLWKINYKQPKLVIGYPFQSGDSICASFSGYGTYCGDHNVAQLGQVCVLADGYGSMALSAGDIYRLSVDESQLLADDVNDSIRQIDSQYEAGQVDADKDIIHYQVHQNGNVVSIDYTIDERATITSLVSDAMGIVYRRSTRNCSAGENGTITLDCPGLRHGHYVLYLNVNGKVYSGNVLVN